MSQRTYFDSMVSAPLPFTDPLSLPREEPTILFVVPSCTVTTWLKVGTVEVLFTSI